MKLQVHEAWAMLDQLLKASHSLGEGTHAKSDIQETGTVRLERD